MAHLFTSDRLTLRHWDDLAQLHRLVYADIDVARFYAGGVKDLDYTQGALTQAK